MCVGALKKTNYFGFIFTLSPFIRALREIESHCIPSARPLILISNQISPWDELGVKTRSPRETDAFGIFFSFLVLGIYFFFFLFISFKFFWFVFATGMFVHAHARCTPDEEIKSEQVPLSFSRWPITLYFSYQGEAFLCLPCPSTGITLWLPGAPCFSLRWPSWSEPSVAADNTWPPRRASCQWPITAPRSASSTLTGRPVWPPLGWSQS